MVFGRHQTGVPAADFAKLNQTRDGDFEDRRWILDKPVLKFAAVPCPQASQAA
jgi:hypothetical protein